MKQNRARTLRIEADVDDAVTKLAMEDRVSVSQIANRALRKYVEWDRAPTNRGMVSVPSMLLAKLMAEVSSDRAVELGKWAGKELFLPNLKAGSPTMSIEKAEEYMRMLAGYGGRFTFDHDAEGDRHVLTIGQRMGKNWSAYYAGALETIFERFLGKITKVTLSDNMCIVEFAGKAP